MLLLKYYFLVSVFFCLIAGVGLYSYLSRSRENVDFDAIDMIPIDAKVIIKINDINSSLFVGDTNTPYLNDFKNLLIKPDYQIYFDLLRKTQENNFISK